jgi:hypothetical protein
LNGVLATWSGAVICPALSCGAYGRWPGWSSRAARPIRWRIGWAKPEAQLLPSYPEHDDLLLRHSCSIPFARHGARNRIFRDAPLRKNSGNAETQRSLKGTVVQRSRSFGDPIGHGGKHGQHNSDHPHGRLRHSGRIEGGVRPTGAGLRRAGAFGCLGVKIRRKSPGRQPSLRNRSKHVPRSQDYSGNTIPRLIER